MAQRPDFYLSPFGRYSWKKTGKIGKFRIGSLRVHRFSRSTDRIKKTNCKKKFLRSSSIGIQKYFFLFNHWPRYERSREVPNDFQIILFGVVVLFIYVFRSTLQYFCLFALSVLCSLYLYQTGGVCIIRQNKDAINSENLEFMSFYVFCLSDFFKDIN